MIFFLWIIFWNLNIRTEFYKFCVLVKQSYCLSLLLRSTLPGLIKWKSFYFLYLSYFYTVGTQIMPHLARRRNFSIKYSHSERKFKTSQPYINSMFVFKELAVHTFHAMCIKRKALKFSLWINIYRYVLVCIAVSLCNWVWTLNEAHKGILFLFKIYLRAIDVLFAETWKFRHK